MKSQQIARNIAACVEQRATYDEQHLRMLTGPSRNAVSGLFPLPAMDPRSLSLLGRIQAMEREMLELCPPGCKKEPVGTLKNRECVWVKESTSLFTRKGDREALAAALAATEGDPGMHVFSDSVEVSLPAYPVAEEDTGDAFRIRSDSNVAEPTHRVNFELFRYPETGAWVLGNAPVVTLLSERSLRSL